MVKSSVIVGSWLVMSIVRGESNSGLANVMVFGT